MGKTTTSVNTAAGLAALEKKVLLVDMDPQANASQGVGYVTQQEHDVYTTLCLTDDTLLKGDVEKAVYDTEISFLKIMPCSQNLAGLELELSDREEKEKRLLQILSLVSEDYDYILIDSPPSLNLLTVNILSAATSVLIPIQCEYYALTGLAELLKIVGLVKKNFNPNLEIEGALLTMYDSRLNLARQVAEDVRSSFSGRVFETVIPRSVKISEAPSFGKPILLYDAMSPGASRYLQLAKEIDNDG